MRAGRVPRSHRRKIAEAKKGLEVYLEAYSNAGNDTIDTSPTFKILEEGNQVLLKRKTAD